MTSAIQNQTVSPSLLATMNPGSAASTAAASSAADTQNRFLKLLVTQMKNQDPLNPMDNAQVTSQMAQLSTVSGIDNLNATLKNFLGALQASDNMQAASMVGHGVLVSGSSLALQSGSAVGGVDLSGAADHVVVTVRDASGAAVHTADLGSQPGGSMTFQWDGKTDAGTTAADGAYSFSVQATQSGNNVSASTLAFGSVVSVVNDSQGVGINVSGVGRVAVSQVTQIF